MKSAGVTSKSGFDFRRRSSGVLMHVTSLPGPHGSGDVGPEAHRFIDFLAAAGQSWWQTLPIGPVTRSPAFSPYDSASAFAGSPWLVSLVDLARQSLLSTRDLEPAPGLSRMRDLRWEATYLLPLVACVLALSVYPYAVTHRVSRSRHGSVSAVTAKGAP